MSEMNLPNILTVSRLFLAGIFLFLIFIPEFNARLAACLVFIAASITDYLDGQIARATHQVSKFGQWMDPIADKVLTISAFVAFLQMDLVPAWMVFIVIGRELVITMARFWLPPGGRAADPSGKQKAFFQFVYISLALVILTFRASRVWNPAWEHGTSLFIYYGMLFITAWTLYSGIQYIWVHRKSFNA